VIRLDRRGLRPAKVSRSELEPCAFVLVTPSEAREPCEKSGLCRLVLALLRMKDCLFSCIDRTSAMLSLGAINRMLFRFPALSIDMFGIDPPVNVDLVGGRGKSDGLVDSTLVPLVLRDAQLLRSNVADKPWLLALLFRRSALRELCRGARKSSLPLIPSPTPSSDSSLRLLARSLSSARLLGDICESCLDILAI